MAGCRPCNGLDGECLVLAGAAAAIQIAQDRSADELAVIAALLTVVSDNLILIAAQRTVQEGQATPTL